MQQRSTQLKEVLPHIKIGLHETDQVVLIIDDYELFDFIDDYLTEECEISYEWWSSTERVGGEIITMCFSKAITIEQLESALLKLSPEMIESIYSLNNNASLQE